METEILFLRLSIYKLFSTYGGRIITSNTEEILSAAFISVFIYFWKKIVVSPFSFRCKVQIVLYKLYIVLSVSSFYIFKKLGVIYSV
jgi:hypothetical protein